MMVGQVQSRGCTVYAEALKGLFKDPNTLFVVSSDFCHWGQDFDYQPIMPDFKDKVPTHIHKSIEQLDKVGMQHIEN